VSDHCPETGSTTGASNAVCSRYERRAVQATDDNTRELIVACHIEAGVRALAICEYRVDANSPFDGHCLRIASLRNWDSDAIVFPGYGHNAHVAAHVAAPAVLKSFLEQGAKAP
jgi:hypothetical protein